MFLLYWCLVCSFGLCCIDAQGQRVAPGVPPQHYQQQHNHGGHQMHQQVPHREPHQQQQQQQQQQFQQQIPVRTIQQHQLPPSGQQVPIQHVQQPGGHDHALAHGSNPQQLLNAANIQHEKAHIAEHLDVPMDTSKMTEQELQYHYFKMHDADNNNKLDGCELIKSLIHWHAEQGKAETNPENAAKVFTDEELVTLIDPILTMDDINTDGFIDYPEFVRAQQKTVEENRQ